MRAATFAAVPEPAEQAWADRNQRWLWERFVFWRERLAPREGDGEPPAAAPPADPGGDFQPSALRVRTLFGLSSFETELLVLAAGVEIDTPLRGVVAQALGVQPREPVRLTFSLALAVLPEPHWNAISPLGPLRHWSLLDFDTAAGFAQSALRIDERVLHYLTGVAAFDERLMDVARLEDIPLEPAADGLASEIARELTSVSGPLAILTNVTTDASHKRTGRALARAAFREVGLRTLWVQSSGLGGDGRDLMSMARRIDREAVLAQAGVAIVMPADAGPAAATMRLIDALRSPVILLGAPSSLDLADLAARTERRFNVPPSNTSPSAGLSPHVRRAADRALQQFRVDPAQLDQALTLAAGLDDQSSTDDQVWDALRVSARGGLDALAHRIDSRATFDDLVVPASVSNQLREIASQLRHRQQVYEEWGFGERDGRGLGIAALFSGESGTGKTLAAEAIANEARLDLYRIDLASVVSKYIGETEKNLSRLFDAAERSGAVLLFDEADALFGKRSEVKDSHDRYANIEVAYLLQRVESYRGLAILTTNMKSALDRAFLRRIRFIVQFPFPDESAREEIWRRQFPEKAPLGEVDLRRLSRLQLSGGSIRSVALNAAFHAAGRREPIGEAALMGAARAEFAKLERNFTPPAATA